MDGGTATGEGIFLSRGYFFVIEGIDGTGKATQTLRLFNTLKSEGYFCEKISFPDYNGLHGKAIRKILDGGEEKPEPKAFGLLYANDREEKHPLIESWLKDKKVVLSDRYTEANLAYQGARVEDRWVRRCTINDLLELDYKKYKLPMPDLVLLLDVPAELAIIDEKKDVNEIDLEYQQEVRKVYNWLFENHIELGYKKWVKIDCAVNNRRLTEEKVGDKIYNVVKEILEHDAL